MRIRASAGASACNISIPFALRTPRRRPIWSLAHSTAEADMAVEWQYMIDIRPTWVNAQQSANWEASVRRHITWISQTQSGRILLNSIKFHKKWVPISPYDGTQGACNAYADAK